MRIAFIGLGNMGAPMARNLIKAGHQLNLFDLNKAVLAELAELGGQISPSPKDAAANSELVITMLPAATHVRSVYLNEDGVLAGIRPGTPTVDCSTIDPQTARDVSKAAAAKGVDMGDAPASRGYTGGFGAELMLKDLGLATEAARQAHQPVILGAVAQQLYQAMSLRGEGGKDFSAIVEGYRKKD